MKFVHATVALAVLTTASLSAQAVVLDGVKDPAYGATPVATDPSGDLANPGPAEWSGVAWTDLTELYVTFDATNAYVFAPLPNYSTAGSFGSFGLAIDVNNTAAGGSSDPWGNAITFNHASLPDFVVRGNTPADGGWTELRNWDGAAWAGGGTNWGGVTGEVGTNVAWNTGNGLELLIPLSSLGVSLGDTLNLLLYAGQTGGSKGAYDTVPSDDQSTGWDAPTTHVAYASVVVPEPASAGLLLAAGLGTLRRRRR